jgi:hypothetical protein
LPGLDAGDVQLGCPLYRGAAFGEMILKKRVTPGLQFYIESLISHLIPLAIVAHIGKGIY